jgi:hypothetical protein
VRDGITPWSTPQPSTLEAQIAGSPTTAYEPRRHDASGPACSSHPICRAT